MPLKLTITPADLQARQLQYTRLATYFGAGGLGAWRQTPAAFDLHVRIVRILDGAEPWPADLPTEKVSRSQTSPIRDGLYSVGSTPPDRLRNWRTILSVRLSLLRAAREAVR
jgi:hypothetical protein